MKREKFLFLGLLVLPLAVAVAAFESLKSAPEIACESVSSASAFSVRLQCAQLKAAQQTPDNLAGAIELVSDASAEDSEAGHRLVKQWSKQLIEQGEAAFQAGDLEKAVRIIELLPQQSLDAQQVQERIRAWKVAWVKGEALEKEAQAQLEKEQWSQAFQLADQLRRVENSYWATERHAALVEQIQSDRELRDWKLKNPVQPTLATQPKASQPKIKFAALRPSPKPALIAQVKKAVPVVSQNIEAQPIDLHSAPQLPMVEPEIEPEPPVLTEEFPVLEPATPDEITPSAQVTPEG